MIAKMIALDWRTIKTFQWQFLLAPFFAVSVGWTNPIVVIPLCAYMGLMYSVNNFAVEEKGALNNLYLTLPVKRRSIVTGRYALSLIMLLCGILLGIAIMPVLNQFAMSKWVIGFGGYAAVIAVSFLLYAVFNIFMFPMLFWLGYQKGKIWGFYLPLILLVVLFSGTYGYLSAKNPTWVIEFTSYATKNMFLVCGGIALLATALLFASYLISVKVYAKRDF